MSEQENSKIAAAKESKIYTTSSGVRVRFKSLPLTAVLEIADAVERPKVPVQWVEALQREEENPQDPDYLKALAEAEQHEFALLLELLFSYSVELVDGMPEGQGWLRKVKRLHRRGMYKELVDYDLDDPDDVKLLYTKVEAFPEASDINMLIENSSVSGQRLLSTAASFRSEDEGDRQESGGREATADGTAIQRASERPVPAGQHGLGDAGSPPGRPATGLTPVPVVRHGSVGETE